MAEKNFGRSRESHIDSKEHERAEIDSGMEQYQQEKEVPIDSYSSEYSFDKTRSEEPLRRETFENRIEDFAKKHIEDIINSPRNSTSYEKIEPLIAHLFRDHAINSEFIGQVGANIAVTQDNNGRESWDIQFGEHDARSQAAYLLALLYIKENVEIHYNEKKLDNPHNRLDLIPHRFLFKPQGAYLNTNDFGMKKYNMEKQKLEDGDVTHLNPFIEATARKILLIMENIDAISAFNEYPEPTSETLERRKAILNNQKDLDLLVSAIPSRKAFTHLHFKYNQLIKKFGLATDDPIADYYNFGKTSKRLEELIVIPKEEEKTGYTLDFVYSGFNDKPVISSPNPEDWRERFTNEVKNDVLAVLTHRASEAEGDEFNQCYKTRLGRGPGSPYNYDNHVLYNFIKEVGVEKTELILEKDNRQVYEQLVVWPFLENMGYDLSKMEPDRAKKQLHEAFKLYRAGIWQYLETRHKSDIEQKKLALGKRGEKRSGLSLLSPQKNKMLFQEGKRMYWQAQQLWKRQVGRKDTDRFYREDNSYYIDWENYDLSNIDFDETKIDTHLINNAGLISALLRKKNDSGNQAQENIQPAGKSANFGLLIKALDSGKDIRGVALAQDKQRFLNELLAGEKEINLDLALADWPKELRNSLSTKEIETYYEFANDYIQIDPNGLTKYATWRSNPESQQWNNILKKDIEKKADLDFRLCLSQQTQEVQGWYRTAAEHVGHDIMSDYLLRFNNTLNGTDQFNNWHDVLYWAPHVQNISRSEAREILSGIRTADENQVFIRVIANYNQKFDKLFNENNPIRSLRELEKRVIAIEKNIDISQFPEPVRDILSAPGFNVSAMNTLMKEKRFQELVDGKLDAEQPFQPHARKFVARDLSDLVRIGLGSQKEKIKGTAKDVKGLYDKLKKLIKGKKIGEKPMEVVDLFRNIPIDIEETIIDLLIEQRVETGPLVEATLHAKSDPDGWVCGNYTDCCMSFGQSNNKDYMFNKGTQYFTIKYGGRIIAQSVVVDSKNMEDNSDVVILDNIEIAHNYQKLAPMIDRAYRMFWAEYTHKPVKVGAGYSDLTPTGAKLETNTFRPKFSLEYSDARGSSIYNLPKVKGVESIDDLVTYSNLNSRDADAIAKLEAEAYPEGMRLGKPHILDVLEKQRLLEVPGAASSFFIRKGKEVAGYVLMLPEESEVNPGERVAHIQDMAILPKFRGQKLAMKMLERIAEAATVYHVPIEAESRASTSYAMIMNENVRTWLENKGFRLTVNKKLEKYLGDEDFYFVRFENTQTEQAD